MKRILGPAAVIGSVLAVCFAIAADRSRPAARGRIELAQKDTTKKESAKKETAAPGKTSPAAKAPPGKSVSAVPPKRSPDEEAVLQAAAAVAKAYTAHDAKGVAAAFTADGEYLDEKGAVFHGRQAIEAEFASFLKDNPETSIEVRVASTRAIAPGVIAADGASSLIRSK